MGFVLLAAASFFALLFILNALIRTLARSETIGFLDTLLAFCVLLIPLAGLIVDNLDAPALDTVERWALILAGLLVICGLLTAWIEFFRPQRLKASRGVFGIGLGVLLAMSSLVVPRLATLLATSVGPLPLPTPINATPARIETGAPAAQTLATLTHTPTPPSPTQTPTATPSRTPRPTDSPTPTRARYLSRTPTFTPTLPNPCLAVMNYNVNMRAAPSLDAEVILTIPFETAVTVYGRSEDSAWWFATYDGQAGWVKAEFITLSSSCRDLPVRR